GRLLATCEASCVWSSLFSLQVLEEIQEIAFRPPIDDVRAISPCGSRSATSHVPPVHVVTFGRIEINPPSAKPVSACATHDLAPHWPDFANVLDRVLAESGHLARCRASFDKAVEPGDVLRAANEFAGPLGGLCGLRDEANKFRCCQHITDDAYGGKGA